MIGHSSGALIAMELALDHPERIRTLTLSEPPAYFLLDEKQKALPAVVEWATVLRRVSPQSDPTESDVAAFMLQIVVVPPGKSARESPRFPIFFEHRRSMRGFEAILNLSIDPSRLDKFGKPVLLVRGIGTAPTHALINDQLKRHFSGAKTIELSGGHNGVLASQDKFLDELDKFLGSAK